LTLPTSAGSANQFLKNSGIAGELEYSSMVENSSGNVGIGTTNPIGDLSVVASGGSGMEFQPEIATDTNRITNFNRSSSTYNNFRLDAAQQEFLISGTEKARLDSSGRLLIGTTSSINAGSTASAMLQVEHSSGSVTGAFYCTADTAQGGTLVLGHGRGSATGVLQNGDTLGDIRFAGADGTDLQTQGARISAAVDGAPGSNDMPGRIMFSTTADGGNSPSERMRIGTGGMISALADAGWESEILYNKNGAGSVRSFIIGRHSATALTAASGTDGTISFKVTTNGNVTNTNNSYGQISDVKLKENIVNASSQWDDIKGIQVRNFNFKEETGNPTHTQIGVVAQELETVSPGLVTESPDTDEEGNDLGTVTKSVNYSVLYMKAVKALQEAQTRIETLESQHADLLARVTALEAA
jgi:hypothetical protein